MIGRTNKSKTLRYVKLCNLNIVILFTIKSQLYIIYI